MSQENKSNIVNLQLSVYTPVASSEIIDRSGYLKYGDNNLFPDYLIELANTSPVHGALCTSIAAMIAGKGITEKSPDIEELKLPALLPPISNDLEKQGGFYLEVGYNLKREKIVDVRRLPFSAVRLSVDKETDIIKGIFFSKDWGNTRKKINEPKFIPVFNPAKKESEPRQVIIVFNPCDGLEKYPKPDYWGAVNHIEVARQIGLYNVNTYLNGLFPSFMIHMKNGVPDAEAQADIVRQWKNNLEGAKNTGKFIMTFNEAGVENSPVVEAFPMTEANTTYLEMSYRQSTEQIMIGHRVTTPRLFGVADSGNGLSSNTDEMKTGLKIFISQVIEPKQRMICDSFERILKFNGVDTQVTIIPNTPIDLTEPVTTTAVKLSEEKKKTDLDDFIALGSDVPAGYILIDSMPVTDYDDEAKNDGELSSMKFVSTGAAFPNAKSEQDSEIDSKLYITRYRYRGELRDNTRQFCRKMLAADKLYRKEDIVRMEDRVVNEGWGPEGSNTYSIWLYKGGGACYHFWWKEVYVSAEGLGIDVNSPNAQWIAVRTAEKAGYKVRNEALVAKLPIDMPYEGFLPTNPRFQ